MYSFNESRFVIDMDEQKVHFFSQGDMLANGIEISDEIERAENFCINISSDGCYNILTVAPKLAQRWLQEGYLPHLALQKHYVINENNEEELFCYYLLSPTSHVLTPITEARANNSLYYARMVASSIVHSRQVDQNVNLRDGILCDLYGVVLPTYTQTPRVADIALFNNTLRAEYAPEDLRSDSDFEDGKSRLNVITIQESLKSFGYTLNTSAYPKFMLGDEVQEFVNSKDEVRITGLLDITNSYEIYALTTDKVLLVLNEALANMLYQKTFLCHVELKPLITREGKWFVTSFSRRDCVENISNRHYGVNQANVFEYALAVSRLRQSHCKVSLKNALYIQKLAMILPIETEELESSQLHQEDREFIYEVVCVGPHATSVFLDDVYLSCLKIVNGQ